MNLVLGEVMRSIRCLALVLTVAGLSACSTMTPTTYSNFADNTVALRAYSSVSKASVLSMNDLSGFNPQCRLMGPVQASGDRTPAQFIRDSFNDELKFADVYGVESGDKEIALVLHKASFSSMSGFTRGAWEFALEVANADGTVRYTVESQYPFQSGYDAMTACKQTAQAMTPAVQRLIQAAVSHPEFAKIMK